MREQTYRVPDPVVKHKSGRHNFMVYSPRISQTGRIYLTQVTYLSVKRTEFSAYCLSFDAKAIYEHISNSRTLIAVLDLIILTGDELSMIVKPSLN